MDMECERDRISKIRARLTTRNHLLSTAMAADRGASATREAETREAPTRDAGAEKPSAVATSAAAAITLYNMAELAGVFGEL